jgi:hypothetical protein
MERRSVGALRATNNAAGNAATPEVLLPNATTTDPPGLSTRSLRFLLIAFLTMRDDSHVRFLGAPADEMRMTTATAALSAVTAPGLGSMRVRLSCFFQ